MIEQMRAKCYERIKFYSDIHKQLHTPKIANLAWEEMIVSFLEYIYKYEGLEDMFQKVSQEKDEKLKMSLAVFLLAFDEARAKSIIQSLRQAEDLSTRESARNIINERYNTLSELAASYGAVLEKFKKKRKISTEPWSGTKNL